MSKLKSIQLAIEIATRQRDALTQAHVEALNGLAHANGQMEQLRGYANDTDARWIGATSTTLSAELIKHHYQFIGRLQQAIEMQSDVLGNIGHQVHAAKKSLVEAEVRLLGLNHLLNSRQATMTLRLRKIEQGQTDEYAAMQFARFRTTIRQGDLI